MLQNKSTEGKNVKIKYVLQSVGLWSVITVANLVQIGLWGKFITTVSIKSCSKHDTDIILQYKKVFTSKIKKHCLIL